MLATMAKKSADSKPGQRSLDSRQFLSHANEPGEICSEYNTLSLSESEDVSTTHISTQSALPASILAAPVAVVEERAPLSVEMVAVADIPLSPIDIVLAIVSQKLRQPFDQVSVEKTLRQLSGGNFLLALYRGE